MDQAPVTLRKLAERVLADDGQLPLALLLEHLVPVARMRDLARRHGLSPKGGFRIERAPARVLAPLLAEQRDGERLDGVLSLLLPAPSGPEAAAEAQALLALREAEVQRLRDELERARDGAARGREREVACERRFEHAQQELVRLRRALDERSRSSAPPPAPGRDDKELLRRLHELESEREGFVATDEALRRRLAHTQSRVRELEEELAELNALVPPGRRRRRPAPEPVEERRFRLPRFTPSFYKSLEGKDRRSIERAVQAVFLFCTEGHAYPGLEVKQLGGQDTWSLRASLGLRVYFRPLPDGDVELLELGDREDQNTTLRRLKER